MSFNISPENARYLLSALAQSQAAIFAIPVSLTFIAIQIADKSVSFLILKYIKKDRIIQSLTVSFLGSVALNIFLISQIDNYFGLMGWTSGILVILGIILLFTGPIMYMLTVLQYLEKESIIKKILKDSFSDGKPVKENYKFFTQVLRKASFYREVEVLEIALNLLIEKIKSLSLSSIDSDDIKYIFEPLYEVGRLFKEDHYLAGINQLKEFTINLSTHSTELGEAITRQLLDFLRFLSCVYILLGETNQTSPISNLFLSFERIASKWINKRKANEEEITIVEIALSEIEKVISCAQILGKFQEVLNNTWFKATILDIERKIVEQPGEIPKSYEDRLLEIVRRIKEESGIS